MDQSFNLEEEGGYWKKLPAEFGGIELRIAWDQVPGPAPDWALIEAFQEFVLAEGPALVGRSQAPLRFLATQTNWFAQELDAASFAWQEVVLLYSESRRSGPVPVGLVFELRFTLQLPGQAWADAYGNWVATYQGTALVGLRREQL